MEQSGLKAFREVVSSDQGFVCPICNLKREPSEFVVDHQHKTKQEKNGTNGAGLIRGVICFMCNSTEGRMLSYFKRSGLGGSISFQQYLRGLAEYLDQPNTNLIHPNEKIKERKLMKRSFNKIKKIHDEKFPNRKKLEYPKSGKVTKLVKEISEEYGVEL